MKKYDLRREKLIHSVQAPTPLAPNTFLLFEVSPTELWATAAVAFIMSHFWRPNSFLPIPETLANGAVSGVSGQVFARFLFSFWSWFVLLLVSLWSCCGRRGDAARECENDEFSV